MKKRNIYIRTWEELSCEKNMIFLTGPRQAGKTTLARMISDSYANQLYFNWDIPEDQIRLVQNPSFFESVKRRDSTAPLIILDEIHKYRHWKNYLKGVCDKFHDTYKFLVSGSGRLDIYQKGGDSLAGRYLLFHLWPFTIAELGNRNLQIEQFLKNPLQISMKGITELQSIWNRLAKVSGFPEPYLAGRITTYRRWSNTYSRQLIHEDIRDLTGVKSIKDMETLYYLLPSRTGSTISIPSLSRDLKVSYNSVHKWLSSFERFFLVFCISPWTKKISRAIQKERKVYLWDFPRIEDPAARFENMVAMELWRAVTAWNDLGYGRFELHFIKNKEHQEVDFLIANEHKPILLIETKLADRESSAALKKFQSALGIPAVQLINEGIEYSMLTNNNQQILVAPAFQWLSQLP
jgi:predicted AAA+ superfamily ATPase